MIYLADSTLEFFKNKYSDFIYKDMPDRVYMRCVNPSHLDHKRSAVLYKNSGIFKCAACGYTTHVRSLIGFCTHKVAEVVEKSKGYLAPIFDFHKYPLHYFYNNQILTWVNADKDGNIIGHGTRSDRRMYYEDGAIGFRLFAPLITESTTDAIFLLERGVNAGSICSIANQKLVSKDSIYFPQIDPRGRSAALHIAKRGIPVFFWNSPKGKDIREISEAEANLIINQLKTSFSLKGESLAL
jgi:hypothetical protein